MQHLFFDPTISNFQGISQNGRIVSANDRKLISNDTTNPSIFLGVKKCIEFSDKVQQIQKDIFLIKHENAFALSKMNEIERDKLYVNLVRQTKRVLEQNLADELS